MALPELQQPNITGNFLSSYYTAQQQQQAQADRQRQMRREDTADQRAAQSFEGQQQLQKLQAAQAQINTVGQILGNVRDGDAAGFQAAQQEAIRLGIPQESVMRYSVNDLPSLKQQFGQAAQALDMQLKRAQLGLVGAQTDLARANASRASQSGSATINLSPRDEKILEDIGKEADGAARGASALRNILPQLQATEDMQGPGFGARRTAAGVLSVIPGVTALEKALTGESVTEQVVQNFDAIEQASKDLGIAKLAEIGGSDTERELLTAIQTTVNPNVSAKENARRFKNQLAAAEILSQKKDLATKWANAFGGMNGLSGNGQSWQGFWSQYQKAAWRDFNSMKPAFGPGSTGARRASGARESADPTPPPGFEIVR